MDRVRSGLKPTSAVQRFSKLSKFLDRYQKVRPPVIRYEDGQFRLNVVRLNYEIKEVVILVLVFDQNSIQTAVANRFERIDAATSEHYIVSTRLHCMAHFSPRRLTVYVQDVHNSASIADFRSWASRSKPPERQTVHVATPTIGDVPV
jgi:hypothetical protein